MIQQSNIEAGEPRRIECTAEEYHSDFGALSHSLLDEFIRSPERYWAIVNGEIKRPQTAAMRLGQLLHSAMEGKRLVYTPEEFASVPADWLHLQPEDVVEIPSDCLTAAGARNTRGKAWQAFLDANPGRVLMKRDEVRGLERYHDWLRSVGQAVICSLEEYDQAEGMAQALAEHPWVRDQVTSAGDQQEHEFTIEWTNELGIRCKCRLDWLQPRPLIIDWKSTRDSSLRACAATSWKYGYHRQQAFYADGAAEWFECEPAEVSMAFAFVETERPHCVTVCELDPVTMVDVGREQNLEAMRRLLECRESGRYRRPGLDEVVTITAPRWAKYEEEYSYGD